MRHQFGLKLPMPLDSLAALVNECLTRMTSRGMVEFLRDDFDPANIRYRLWQYQLGDVAEINLRKVNGKSSEISVTSLPRPRDRRLTTEERDALEALPRIGEGLQKRIDIEREIREETHKEYRRLRVWHQRIIDWMFTCLRRDPVYRRAEQEATRKKRVGASRLEERADWPDKVDEVHKYLDSIKKGTEPEAAAAFAGGVTARTMRNRMARMRELGMNVYDE